MSFTFIRERDIYKIMYCNYIVKISVSQLAKLARVPETAAAASLIPAQQQRRWLSSSRSESGHSRGLGAPQELKQESCGQIL